MIEGVLNERNTIFLPLYYALFFMGTSNIFFSTVWSIWNPRVGRLKEKIVLSLRIMQFFAESIEEFGTNI